MSRPPTNVLAKNSRANFMRRSSLHRVLGARPCALPGWGQIRALRCDTQRDPSITLFSLPFCGHFLDGQPLIQVTSWTYRVCDFEGNGSLVSSRLCLVGSGGRCE